MKFEINSFFTLFSFSLRAKPALDLFVFIRGSGSGNLASIGGHTENGPVVQCEQTPKRGEFWPGHSPCRENVVHLNDILNPNPHNQKISCHTLQFLVMKCWRNSGRRYSLNPEISVVAVRR